MESKARATPAFFRTYFNHRGHDRGRVPAQNRTASVRPSFLRGPSSTTSLLAVAGIPVHRHPGVRRVAVGEEALRSHP